MAETREPWNLTPAQRAQVRAAHADAKQAAWRNARAADARAKRNQRGRRPAPQVTGVRVDPGRNP